MKSNCVLRQILIAVLIVALFAIGLFGVLFIIKDAPITVLSAYDINGATAVVFRSESKKTGADCPLYSLGENTYLALFDASCSLSGGVMGEMDIARNGDECEIAGQGEKETRPVEKAQTDGKQYEFFGGEISFYPFEKGWISVISLMNHAGDAAYERVQFGTIEMTAKQYREAYPKQADGLHWDEENEAYIDEKTGSVYKTRTAPAFEIPVLYRTQGEDAYVCFYLTDADYLCMMEDMGFALPDVEGGHMSAMFWKKE
ncbi:MAG: hypothetical protein IKJ65_08100 [Clostridia bacterium]|nr:hypothetical protein [Clostridia bacterium]